MIDRLKMNKGIELGSRIKRLKRFSARKAPEAYTSGVEKKALSNEG